MTHPVDKGFIRQGKDYHTLICYQKAVCIYDITYYFAHKYLQRGDRTIDQMIQAARSGAETICNIAITLIRQTDVLLKWLIEWQKQHFKENGGIKEQMYRERTKNRRY